MRATAYWAGLLAYGALLSDSAFAQTAAPTPLAAACRVRVTVLENYSPFRPAVAAGNKLLAAAASGDVRVPLATFDRALAAALDTVPSEEAAVFALTDAERIVEMIERCADASGTPRDKAARAAMSLEAAYRRNLATMQRSDFAERLLRSPRAKAVLLSSSGGEAVMADAQAIKAANSAARREALLAEFQRAEERRARIEAEWREKEARLAAENAERRRLIEAPIRASEAIWRAGASAPAAGAQLCADDRIHGYAGRRKDADWMMLIEAEIGRCARISDRTDGSFFMGLALGTTVTDEQLAHAAGRALMCLSTSNEKQLLDNIGQLTDQLFTSSIGKTGMRAQPVWSERTGARGRIVQIRCDLTMTLFGIDFHQAQQALAGGLEADASSFVEYELANGVLSAVRTHFVLSGTSRTENWSNDTTHYCDASLSQADAVAAMQRGGGWKQLGVRPWTYAIRNDALTRALVGPQSSGVGSWFTMQRGAVVLDIYNTRYSGPILGENGNCGGGAVDRFAMLAPVRAKRVQVGTPIAW
ncbi:hypothetical protein AN936_02415 [Sphingopyxis macrogoltabida]|uniref:Uncharacterized protein n=1 Tax=Sphingopyxis macrogoltabida TaxID=33050 RepID=A0A0N9U7S6_SPHMC|nr:hypothetical protein AN936_02415 [Sphingopyxis macrogoltabida]